LWAAVVALTIATSLTVLLISRIQVTGQTFIVLLAIVVLAFLYSLPPIHLAGSGYGELLLAVLTANLVPAFAYLLQQGELHRLLAMTTFPLTALYLAMVIAYSFRHFARDVRYEIPTLLVRIGWRDGMNVHNLLIFSAYLLLGLAMMFGLPAVLALPAFLPLPLGLLQIWTMIRVSGGARPNWRAIHLTASTLFFATAYLLSYAYWTR
jgi:1,4-dihydroxy-2-naphthoate octaprenyltransferase